MFAVVLTVVCGIATEAQDTGSPAEAAPAASPTLKRRTATDVNASGHSQVEAAANSPIAASTETVALTVPKGSAVQVVLDQEIKIQKVGQPLHGRVAEPIFAFDKLVVPVGSEVTGHIKRLTNVSGARRFLDALDADFTPARKVEVQFDELALSDGRHIPIRTSVTPGSGQVIKFLTSAEGEKKKSVKDVAAEKADQAKQEAKQQWKKAMEQVHQPGKIRKIERYAIAQLPVHPQYVEAGTVYFAELEEPLEFGSEVLTPEMAAAISTPPPPGSFVHARLEEGLSSATSQKGDEVDAVLAQPLFDGKRLLLPQGTRLKGTVVQVRAARRLSRNGQLRMVFHEIVLPDGVEKKVEASLEGVQATNGQEVKLDAEGGAEANSPKTRYLQSGIAVALALASSRSDSDNRAGDVGGNTGGRVAGGAGGLKLVGMALGATVHSQPLGLALGTYGASMSIYGHFIARGRDVEFPKNTAMEIGIGTRAGSPGTGHASQ
jgi:hypothetical protein